MDTPWWFVERLFRRVWNPRGHAEFEFQAFTTSTFNLVFVFNFSFSAVQCNELKTGRSENNRLFMSCYYRISGLHLRAEISWEYPITEVRENRPYFSTPLLISGSPLARRRIFMCSIITEHKPSIANEHLGITYRDTGLERATHRVLSDHSMRNQRAYTHIKCTVDGRVATFCSSYFLPCVLHLSHFWQPCHFFSAKPSRSPISPEWRSPSPNVRS